MDSRSRSVKLAAIIVTSTKGLGGFVYYTYVRIMCLCVNALKVLSSNQFSSYFLQYSNCWRSSEWEVNRLVWHPIFTVFKRFSTHFSFYDPEWTFECILLACHVKHNVMTMKKTIFDPFQTGEYLHYSWFLGVHS